MPRAITAVTFKALPAREQSALLGGIAALNAVVAYKEKRAASTASEITALAFAKCAELHVPGESDHLLDSIKATARSKGWSDAEIEDTRAEEVQQSYDINFVTAVVQMGDVLEQLIKNKRLLAKEGSLSAGRMIPGGNPFGSLAATFNSGVLFEPARVVLSEKGFGEIDVGMRFKTALGLVAWTIIRLSQLRAHAHVVLLCAECREFKIVSIRKPQRFCSSVHRNLFNVRQFRVRAARAAKHK